MQDSFHLKVGALSSEILIHLPGLSAMLTDRAWLPPWPALQVSPGRAAAMAAGNTRGHHEHGRILGPTQLLTNRSGLSPGLW